MRDQMRGHTRSQDIGEQIPIIGFEDLPGDAAIRTHQVDDVARERREVSASGARIENDAQRLLNPAPARFRNVREHVIDMRMSPECGDDAENEIIKGDF